MSTALKINLFHQEIEVFLPLIEPYEHQFEQPVRRIKPLFQTTSLGRLDLNFHYYKVKYTRGVSKILEVEISHPYF